MRKFYLALGTLVLASLAHVQPGAAQEAEVYAWCADIGSVQTCSFRTLEQCLETARGEGQGCSPNPAISESRAQATDEDVEPHRTPRRGSER
jgi:hypothetical protein